MIETVRNVLKKYIDISCESTFITGFSGGWDSMCLLDIMNKLSKEYGFLLVAAHLNHNWRGKESEAEKERCLAFCDDNDITFISDTLDENVKMSELAAREMRYNFFKKCAQEFEADAVLTAHTKSDNAETILYRIIKGTGLKGLEGIRELRNLGGFKVIRPILNFSRRDIEEYCIKNELYPNNDSSNFNTKYARNNIRHNIMPAIKHINPNVENALITLADIAAGSSEAISGLMLNIKNQITFENKWLTQNFLILNGAVKQHFVYKLLLDNNIEPGFAKIQEIINFIEDNQNSKTGKTLSVSREKVLFASHKYTYFIENGNAGKIDDVIVIDKEGSYVLGGAYKLTIEKNSGKIDKFPKNTGLTAYADLSGIGFPFVLRTRRNGDIIQPFGMQGRMKLKKYFINKNIPDLKILFSEEELNSRIKELAPLIEAEFPENETIYAVCVLKGSVMFFTSLLKYFKHNVRMEFIRISSYGNETKSSRNIQAVDLNLPDLKDKNVLIVEDIIDTGLTAEFLVNMFKTQCRPKKLIFTALCNKKCARIADIEPDFYGFEIGSKFIAGFGMDYKGYFRNLPYIGWFPQNEKE